MSKLIKIDYFPKYINKITSFHFISDEDLIQIQNYINEEHFFIENFFRISKKFYEHVSKENLLVEEIIDNQEINVITNYLEFFSNNFDLLDLLQYNLNYYSDSVSSLSVELTRRRRADLTLMYYYLVENTLGCSMVSSSQIL